MGRFYSGGLVEVFEQTFSGEHQNRSIDEGMVKESSYLLHPDLLEDGLEYLLDSSRSTIWVIIGTRSGK